MSLVPTPAFSFEQMFAPMLDELRTMIDQGYPFIPKTVKEIGENVAQWRRRGATGAVHLSAAQASFLVKAGEVCEILDREAKNSGGWGWKGPHQPFLRLAEDCLLLYAAAKRV